MMALFMLTRAFLDRQGCTTPGCTSPHGTELSLSGQCHFGAPVLPVYSHEYIRLLCSACSGIIADIAITGYLEGPRRPHGEDAIAIYDRGTLLIRCFGCDMDLAEAQVTP
jgi:hypothetical protein